jgi:hypothetical protein
MSVCITTIAQDKTQDKLTINVAYNISWPLGTFKDNVISNTSFRGGSGEISYFIHRNFSVGLYGALQDYYQKYDRQLLKVTNTQTVSAVLSYSVQVVPIMLRGTFFPLASRNALVLPYVSVAAGVNWINYNQYFGEFQSSDHSSPLGLQAGAGFKVPIKKVGVPCGITLGGTYNYCSYKRNGINKLNTVGFNIGGYCRFH